MQINLNKPHAYLFTNEEQEVVRSKLADPLLRAYLMDCLHSLYELSILDSSKSSDDLRVENAYIQGQAALIKSLLAEGDTGE